MRIFVVLFISVIALLVLSSVFGFNPSKACGHSQLDNHRVAYTLECLTITCQDPNKECSDSVVKACTLSALNLFPLKPTKE